MMEQTKRQARRLARNLKPEHARRVLWQPRYRTEAYLLEHLDRCDDELIQNPQAGLRLAKVGPKLALLIAPEMDQRGRTLYVRALAMLGGAYRYVGPSEKGEAYYQEALKVAEAGISAKEWARLLHRLASLRASQDRFVEAIEFLDQAAEIFEGDPGNELGEIMVKRGWMKAASGHLEQGIEDLGCALAMIDPRVAPRVYMAGVGNLACALSKGSVAGSLTVLPILRSARRMLPRGRSLLKAKLIWIEGRCYANLMMDRIAERRLQTARRQLESLGAQYDSILAALDLLQLYLAEGRWFPIQEISTKMLSMVRSGDRKIFLQLHTFSDTCEARTLDVQTLQATRAVLENHVLHLRHKRWRVDRYGGDVYGPELKQASSES
jgi:tetratricopeptide (TPR) repeat protein